MSANFIPKQKTIAQEGLQNYLDRTKTEHNNLGYDDLVRLVNSGVNKANLARAFTVNPRTMYKWVDIYNEEQGNG